MCGRITLSYADAIKLADELGVPVESLPEEFQPENYKPGVNIADVLNLPQGAVVEGIEVTLRGKIANS